jgi:anti-anti-sigma regulatory factor
MAEPIRLCLDGALTVARAEDVRDAVLAALAEPAGLVVDCSGATQVDLAFLQIMLAAARTAATRGTSLSLAAAPSGPLATALARGGFAPDPARSADPDHVFWREAC